MGYLIHVSVDQAGAGTTVLNAAVPGSYLEVMSYVLTMDADGTLAWSDGTDWLSGDMEVSEKGGFALVSSSGNHPLMATAAKNRPIQITTVGGGAQGHVTLRVP